MRKYLPTLIALALFSSVEAGAVPITYTADLLGANEDPPNASTGTGTATIVFDEDAQTLEVDASFQDLVAPVTIAHIHCCTAVPFAGNIGVATPTPTFPGFPAGVLSGLYFNTFDLGLGSSWNAPFLAANGGPAGATAALALGLAQGRAYFNIHSTSFPGGEIRGFLTPVPEPSTMGLIAIMSMATLALARRKTGH